MRQRDYQVYIDDILESIKKIRVYINGMSEQAFYEDLRAQDAVIRRLEIIGEGAATVR